MADLAHRCEDPADGDVLVSRFEAAFGMPCYITQDQQRRLHKLFDEIISAPENQPVEGVHWLSGSGSKPNWSKRDAAFLGIRADPDAPDSGEPTFDDGVLFFESTARGFVSEKEQRRTLRERARWRAVPEMVMALKAVAYFWGKDPKAFGDEATVTSLAGQFAAVADQCRRALDAINGTDNA